MDQRKLQNFLTAFYPTINPLPMQPSRSVVRCQADVQESKGSSQSPCPQGTQMYCVEDKMTSKPVIRIYQIYMKCLVKIIKENCDSLSCLILLNPAYVRQTATSSVRLSVTTPILVPTTSPSTDVLTAPALCHTVYSFAITFACYVFVQSRL